MNHKTEPKQDCDFPAAILKGLVEKGDGTSYFGSLIAYDSYKKSATDRGWITHDEVTPEGHRVYTEAGLATLPCYGRAYMWDWSQIDLRPYIKHED